MSTESSQPAQGSHAEFQTTRWSLIIGGAMGTEEALERLCRMYWYPIYAYVRRKGHAPAEAQDLTQAFFIKVIHGELLKKVTRREQRFRSFLLACIKNFLLNERDRVNAQKRGAGKVLGWDDLDTEERYKMEPSGQPPEALFDSTWAVNLVNLAISDLRRDWIESGRTQELFDALSPFLTEEAPDGVDAEISKRFNDIPLGTLKSYRHRLRKGYADRLKDEIRETLDQPDERTIRDELQHLFSALTAK